MAIAAGVTRTQAGVGCAMARRSQVALKAGAAGGLLQQAVVGGTVWLMTFCASGAIDQMSVADGMLIDIWTGHLRVAFLTAPIEAGRPVVIFDFPQLMTVGATDIACFQWVPGAIFKLGGDFLMTGLAEVLLLIEHESIGRIAVNFVTGGAGQAGQTMRIAGAHGGLMLCLMAASANFSLFGLG